MLPNARMTLVLKDERTGLQYRGDVYVANIRQDFDYDLTLRTRLELEIVNMETTTEEKKKPAGVLPLSALSNRRQITVEEDA